MLDELVYEKTWSDSYVYAVLMIGNGWATILEFSSREPRKGHARRALQKLKAAHQQLMAQDIGYAGDDSCNFWLKMASEGLVDRLLDNDLKEVIIER